METESPKLPNRIAAQLLARLKDGRVLGGRHYDPHARGRRTMTLYTHPEMDLQIGTLSNLSVVIRWAGMKWRLWGEWELVDQPLRVLDRYLGWSRVKWGDARSDAEVQETKNQSVVSQRRQAEIKKKENTKK